MTKTSKKAPEKKEAVKQLTKLGEEYPIIGVLNMHGLPGAQLARMRKQLRGKCEIIMTRQRLITLALDNLKEKKQGIEHLKDHLKGMPALLFTKENPFALFKTIKKAKSKAPAKGGQQAPFDLVIPKGPTPFAPGPVISELAGLGIKAGVEGGKVAVKQDSLVCKEGQVIKPELAALLTRLGIEPMEIGLDLVAVYEKGTIYPKNVLDIDEEKFLAGLAQAATWAFNLAIDAGYPTADTMEPLLQAAHREAKAVAKEGNVLTSETAEEAVEQAEREMRALKESLPAEAVTPAPMSEKKEETPAAAPEKNEEQQPQETPAQEKKEETPAAEKKKETPRKDSGKKTAEPTDAALKQITDDKAHQDAENLAKELVKKGTLRK